MQLLYSRNAWFYSLGFNIMIDFCIWVLQVDGRHVRPFDQHPDGDGSLRATGLTGEDWQSWLLRVIDQQNKRKQLLHQHVPSPKDLFSILSPEGHHPPSAWIGSTAVRNKLNELWVQYGPISNQRKRRELELTRALNKVERNSNKRLYDELKPYYTRIPPLTIYEIAYEYPLDYIVAPATLLMSVQEGQPEPQEFNERVLAAAAELAAYPARRSRQVVYTRVVDNSDRSVAAYCRHARKAVPPAPPRPAVPRPKDAARQVVFEELADEYSFVIADLATAQFLREKNRPGWRLYEIAFQEIDGEQCRQIVILRQNADSSWRHVSSSSSSDMQNQWSRIFAPVRDHPLIILWYQGGNGPDVHTLHAYGNVIDNGFHVERVRLVNNVGLVLEDIVEDGFVFFAYEQKQEIELPMQAELYDNGGKLVWSQTVFSPGGLPPWLRLNKR
jgi:hypothetical protein